MLIMQPLGLLSNTQKARLLHALFFNEIPAFLDYLEKQCLTIEEQAATIREEWQQPLLSADMWIGLSAETLKALRKYAKALRSSSNVFSEQLFFGYSAIFLCHQLQAYVVGNPEADPKFKTAIELLFND